MSNHRCCYYIIRTETAGREAWTEVVLEVSNMNKMALMTNLFSWSFFKKMCLWIFVFIDQFIGRRPAEVPRPGVDSILV